MDRTVLFNLQRMGMEKHADLFRENRIKWETLREMSPLTMSSLFAGKVNELFEFERAYKKLNGNWAIPETELPPSGSQDESQQSDREDDDETQFVPPVIDSHETSRLNSTSEPNPDHTSEGTSGDTRKRNAESETETPPPKQPRPTEANVVEEYLKPGLIGKVLLSVGRKRSFDQSNRVKLAETIVLGELGNDAEKSISQKRLSFLSECIVKIFPLETAAIYFTPRVPAKGLVPAVQPKGVLVDKYHNLLRVLRQEGLRTSNRRSRCDEGDEDDFSDSGGDDALDYLEKNSLAKKSVTIAKWHETVHKRYSMLLNTVDRKSKARMGQEKIDVYYNQFPCLKQQWGLDLLMDDFDELFANRCLNVLENWTSIVAKLEKVLQKVYTPDACCTEAGENVRLLQAIPSLFRQPPVPYGKKLAKGELRVHWKPNRQESVNGFLLHAENNSILTDRVQQIKDKCGKVYQTLQPFAAVVGPTPDDIEDCYVILDSIWYKVESPLAAVDSCFKIIQVLHSNYPVQSSYSWMYLQHAVYQLSTNWDLNIPGVIGEVERFRRVSV